jgi:hypothetical protein
MDDMNQTAGDFFSNRSFAAQLRETEENLRGGATRQWLFGAFRAILGRIWSTPNSPCLTGAPVP